MAKRLRAKCTVDGCTKKHAARGLCAVHYAISRKAGTLPPRLTETTEERFWQKVDRSKGESACWEWTASLNRLGYGMFWDKKYHSAHRYAYRKFVSAIPDGFDIDHSCRNRKCVNPRHLQPVPHSVNMQNLAVRNPNNRSTGYRGTTVRGSRVRAYGSLDGRRHHIGYFDTPEQAAEAAAAWRLKNMPNSLEDKRLAENPVPGPQPIKPLPHGEGFSISGEGRWASDAH